jgi:hypothetical protein
MDDNYTGNGSNNTNGLQIERYFLDTGSAYINSHSKHSMQFTYQNIVMLRNNTDKTPYELWKGRPTKKFYIKREDGRMGKFDSRVDKGILVGYSSTRKAYKCYNLRLNKAVESINITIDETGIPESKKEENKSMEQLFEEEDEK